MTYALPPNFDDSRSLVSLPQDPEAVRIARDAVSRAAAMLPEERVADAQLLVSELVTNAVKFGRGPITLAIEIDPDRAYFEVTDEGGGRPEMREPGVDGGWGLHLLDSLSSEWGIRDGSTHVWFTLTL